MRDHRKLRAFELADDLVVSLYLATKTFPREEVFGLTSQIRRAAVSVASNIVEGCARHSEADYIHFLDMAYGSMLEVEYQVSLARRLGYLTDAAFKSVGPRCHETGRVLNGLIQGLRRRFRGSPKS